MLKSTMIPFQRLDLAPEQVALRLLLARAPQLAPDLHSAVPRGAEVPQSRAAHRSGYQDHGRSGVCLRAGGLSQQRLPRGHRGEEHVSRV